MSAPPSPLKLRVPFLPRSRKKSNQDPSIGSRIAAKLRPRPPNPTITISEPDDLFTRPSSVAFPSNSAPPDIPLPQLPTRQRAQTLASLPDPPLPTHRRKSSSLSSIEKENHDLSSLSTSQLQSLYHLKSKQFDDLQSYLKTLLDSHANEKALLQKRIQTLEKDALRKDKEIKGLTWLVANSRPTSSDGVGRNSSASKSMSSLSEHFSDSETLQTIDSTASLPILSSRKRSRSRTPLPVSDILPPNASKRASISSVTSTTSSSSSTPTKPKLSSIPEVLPSVPPSPLDPPPLPPSRDPAIAAAIQAAERFHHKEFLLTSQKPQRHAKHKVSPAESESRSIANTKEKEKERRALNRLSAPNLRPHPPTLSPAAAYAANLRRGQSTSITQVLEQAEAIPNSVLNRPASDVSFGTAR